MGLFYAIWMIVLGILGAAGLIIAKKPDAKELIEKLTPYQGWIGFVSGIWGIWVTIHAILNINVLTALPIWWITWLAMGILLIALGLLLGIAVFKTFVKKEEVTKKLDMMVEKLLPYQGILGLISIGVGIWGLIAYLMYC